MERKLASVEVIHEILPIEGYDMLQLVKIQGWQVVLNVKQVLGKLDAVGTKVIFLEEDAVLPEERFGKCHFWKFLKQTYMGGLVEHKVLKNGIKSEGMILSLSLLQHDPTYEVGTSVAKELGIVKFYKQDDPERPVEYQKFDKKVKKKKRDERSKAEFLPFPDFMVKTDQLRLQSHLDLLEVAGPHRFWTATQKFDGTSVQFFIKDTKVGICTRNREVNMEKPDKTDLDFVRLNEKYKIHAQLQQYGLNIAIQCECYGLKINGNRHKREDVDLVVFDIYDLDTRKFWSFDRVETLMNLWGIPTVPRVFSNRLFHKDAMLKELEDIANAQILSHGGPCEGIVVNTSDGFEPHVHFKVLCKI
jgi:hypothetical protein